MNRFRLYILVVTAAIFLLGVANSSLLSEKEYNAKIFFGSKSSLKIHCKTNINRFDCDFNLNKLSDSLMVSYSTNGSLLEFSKANLILPNVFFNCGGQGINKDFHTLLKTKEFPEIQLTLIRLNFLSKDLCTATAEIDIVICGIIKTYKIPITINSDHSINVEGKLPIDILDFSLEPPSKVLGMIKVSNEIEIEFNLNILRC